MAPSSSSARPLDFGFSKQRDEAAKQWNEREVLGDMVRVIRMFRPLVIYSRWGGTSADGHGHHQLAGYLTPLAFKAAADPNEFPEQLQEGLRPWQTRKLYSRPLEEAPATLQVQTGVFDPALGRTYAEIAFEGRSQHKSQNQGTIETLGPLASGLRATRDHRRCPEAGAVHLRRSGCRHHRARETRRASGGRAAFGARGHRRRGEEGAAGVSASRIRRASSLRSSRV